MATLPKKPKYIFKEKRRKNQYIDMARTLIPFSAVSAAAEIASIKCMPIPTYKSGGVSISNVRAEKAKSIVDVGLHLVSRLSKIQKYEMLRRFRATGSYGRTRKLAEINSNFEQVKDQWYNAKDFTKQTDTQSNDCQ